MNLDSVRRVFAAHGVGEVAFHEPLAKHTTWRIGGPADVFVCPRTVEELRGAVQAAKALAMPWTVIGRGSNLLVLDGGIRGLVIKLADQFADIDVEGTRLTALAGRSYVSAAHIAIRHHLAGLEFATGIPGTVGGAVMMNAGAHGGETKDVLLWADVMDGDGDIHRYTNADLRFGYRYSILKDRPGIVVQAAFQLRPGDPEELMAKVRAWSARRNSTQPLSLPNCGSVFRNPAGMHAGRLIEEAGLKGFRRNDAQISEKHANFIVNLGHATAEDVLWLMQYARDAVWRQFGVWLETEVRILGEPAPRG
ncbi:UDP-N-acetylenolpyruvoylglucosamine reductase [Alicyclobacillus cellulosilyticus]|uniref:UDP-N-acetylenolpyruvoylglucosamine reductase n=1 Tax=Alicyclobacillus cellulosilyticus TaxID=1003997 RepID=A0A917NGY5_9BACL|nr:UDP-N-acetylmuramate dehydrogenase [Alicyclobacillus cellulosilyticus]GGI97199.1 UDP-N-acetylenolpyruvoylglucosamine reductase [Alicyclobacillus cellulosilyticus]